MHLPFYAGMTGRVTSCVQVPSKTVVHTNFDGNVPMDPKFQIKDRPEFLIHDPIDPATVFKRDHDRDENF